jgi:hypothetical protein
LPRFKAAKFEKTILEKIEKMRLEPDEFVKRIKDTIDNLEVEREQLEARMKPISKQITKLNEDLAILDTRFEMHRIDAATYKARVFQIQNQVNTLERQRNETDPLLLARFNYSQEAISHLRAYVDFIDSLVSPRKIVKVAVGGSTEHPELVIETEIPRESPSPVALTPEQKALGGKVLETMTHAAQIWQAFFATELTPREWLLKQNALLFVYPGRIELKGAVALGQSITSFACRSARCRQSR